MADIDALLDAQAKKNEEERGASKWEPEAGDTLDGILIKTGWYDGGDYEPSLWLMVKDMDGVVHRVYCPTVLLGQMREEMPAIGSGIAIRYEGRVQSEKSSRKYHAYTLVLVPTADGEVLRDYGYWREHGFYGKATTTTTNKEANDDGDFF